MKTVSDLVTQIDLLICKAEKEEKAAIAFRKGYEKLKEGIQSICEHKHKDGSDAFEEYAHDSHHRYERCSICQKEISI